MNPANHSGPYQAASEARSLDAYHSRVQVQSSLGNHVRYVTGAFASALVDGGSARTSPTAGRIRSVVLVRSAANSAHRTGEPGAGRANGVRFYRWRYLEESARRIVEHHPRCTYD